MPSMATESVRRNEPTLCATSGCEQSQQRSPLFDHLVGEREEIVGNLDTERLGGFEIDDKLELGR